LTTSSKEPALHSSAEKFSQDIIHPSPFCMLSSFFTFKYLFGIKNAGIMLLIAVLNHSFA
jgi:hypothetical protein